MQNVGANYLFFLRGFVAIRVVSWLKKYTKHNKLSLIYSCCYCLLFVAFPLNTESNSNILLTYITFSVYLKFTDNFLDDDYI